MLLSTIVALLIEASEGTPWTKRLQTPLNHSIPHFPQPVLPPGDRDPLEKPAIQPPLNRSLIDPPLYKYLPITSFNVTEYDDGLGPRSCKDYFTTLNITDWEAFRVTFADCPVPWTMCRELSAEASRELVIDIFSHIPLSIRTLVRHFVAARDQPSRPAGYAEWAWGDVHALGFGALNMWVITHELGHGIDWSSVPNAPRGGEPISSGQEWRDALVADSAVVSQYATMNEHEAFAETVVVALFDIYVPGGLAAVNSNWTAVRTQVETVKKVLRRFLSGGGGCGKRVEDSPAVPM